MKMVQKKITVKFNTPAFLGDAEQKGRWRTPPFKALLRQWWRVVAAKDFEYDYGKLRKQEGVLFGHAWLKEGSASRAKTWAMKSQILIALSEWKVGSKSSWQFQGNVDHPEVGQKGRQVDASLYMGYGPLTYNNQIRRTDLKIKPAIEENSSCLLTLIYPDQQETTMCNLLNLLQCFGSIGGRSRNGWGSFNLEGDGVSFPDKLFEISRWYETYSRNFRECLQLDWPHALGKDDKGPLCWKTEPKREWTEVMKNLAEIKVGFRTRIPINNNKDKEQPCITDRHLLAYPITNHGVDGWCEKNKDGSFKLDRHGFLKPDIRLANQLRFKILRQNDGQFIGIAYHLPCGLPKELMDKLSPKDKNLVIMQNQLQVWKTVHQTLDGKMTRIKGGQHE